MKHEYIVTKRPNLPPTHPGAILREDVLPALKISITEAAKQLHLSRQAFHKILAEKNAVSPEMAVKLAKFCGSTPSFWLGMQQYFDLWHAEKKLSKEIKEIPSHLCDVQDFNLVPLNVS